MLKKMNLSDQAYDELVKKIISGGYPGGTTLQEEKLASEFGISRTPVREALKRLAAEGLIEQLPRKGFRVAMPDDDALTELFECRCGLELLALKNAMGAIPPEKIETLKEKLRSAARRKDSRRIALEADGEMHALFSDHCGNRYLSALIQQFRTKTAPYRNYRNRERAPLEELITERMEILDAVLAGDTEKASILLRKHILKGKSR